MFKLCHQFPVYILQILCVIVLAEYHIKEGVIPSFLNYSFDNLAEDIFPRDISIKLSITRSAGTLFYSIDSRSNQLIVSLNEGRMTLQFNNKPIYIDLPLLCRCELCKFKIIQFRIQITDMIYLQCDNGIMQSYKLEQSNQINKNYPIPEFAKSEKLQARLWLVNTPHTGDIYPNSAQLTGCIFEVLYNKSPIKMGTYKVGDKCPITCRVDNCHLGQCFETYQSYPICNCTETFKNGQFCNETVINRSFVTKELLQFKIAKLSFKCKPPMFLKLNNSRVSLEVMARNNSHIYFTIELSEPIERRLSITISKKYQPDFENILLLEFNDNDIYIKHKYSTSKWNHFHNAFFHDFSREIFERIELRCSEGGGIDFYHKNDYLEQRWSRPDFSPDKPNPPTKVNVNHTTSSKPRQTITMIYTMSEITTTSLKVGISKVHYPALLVWLLFPVLIIITLLIMILVLLYRTFKRVMQMDVNKMYKNREDCRQTYTKSIENHQDRNLALSEFFPENPEYEPLISKRQTGV